MYFDETHLLFLLSTCTVQCDSFFLYLVSMSSLVMYSFQRHHSPSSSRFKAWSLFLSSCSIVQFSDPHNFPYEALNHSFLRRDINFISKINPFFIQKHSLPLQILLLISVWPMQSSTIYATAMARWLYLFQLVSIDTYVYLFLLHSCWSSSIWFSWCWFSFHILLLICSEHSYILIK